MPVRAGIANSIIPNKKRPPGARLHRAETQDWGSHMDKVYHETHDLVKTFQNERFGAVRVVECNGEPWFVASDVCRALSIINSRDAIARLDDDEKADVGLTDISSNGVTQSRNMSIVNEPGLYTLVLGSRKPEAKAFKRWITHEVIPSIRKTGSYSVPQAETAADVRAKAMLLNAKSRMLAAASKAVSNFNLSPVALETLGITMIEEYAGVKTGYRPPVEKTYTATELGQMFGVSANMIGRIAKEHGLKTEQYGITVLDRGRNSDKQVPCFRYNEAGKQRIAELIEGME